MARIRTIKPDFWTDGTMIGLSFEARLFYIGTWNFTLCDRGHLPDDPMGLKLRIFPGDNVDPVAVLTELLDAGRIVRVQIDDGRTFLSIPRFGDHQKVDTRWNSRCPLCTHLDSPNLTGVSERNGETRGISEPTRPGGEGKGKESKGGEGNTPPPRKCPKHINDASSPPCGACRDARLDREDWEAAKKSTPTPAPKRFSALPPEECSPEMHKWDGLGWCVICAASRTEVESRQAS